MCEEKAGEAVERVLRTVTHGSRDGDEDWPRDEEKEDELGEEENYWDEDGGLSWFWEVCP